MLIHLHDISGTYSLFRSGLAKAMPVHFSKENTVPEWYKVHMWLWVDSGPLMLWGWYWYSNNVLVRYGESSGLSILWKHLCTKNIINVPYFIHIWSVDLFREVEQNKRRLSWHLPHCTLETCHITQQKNKFMNFSANAETSKESSWV